MLVLSRKCGEKIVIGADIVVTVLAVKGERVKVGLEAPQGVPIRRHELRSRIAQRPIYPDSTESTTPQVQQLNPTS